MLVLALDSSQSRGAVALFEVSEDRAPALLAEAVGSTSVVHSEGLLSLLNSAMLKANKGITEVDSFGCGIGPGSFTGIRVGIATLKTLAQVLGKPIVPFSSLRALALSVQSGKKQIIPVVKAYQGMIFSGCFRAGGWEDFSCLPQELESRIENFSASDAHFAQDVPIEPRGLVAAWQEAFQGAAQPGRWSYLAIQAQYVRLSAPEEKLRRRG